MKEFLLMYECEYDVGGQFSSGHSGAVKVMADSYADACVKLQCDLENTCGGSDLTDLVWFEEFTIPTLK